MVSEWIGIGYHKLYNHGHEILREICVRICKLVLGSVIIAHELHLLRLFYLYSTLYISSALKNRSSIVCLAISPRVIIIITIIIIIIIIIIINTQSPRFLITRQAPFYKH
jgi:formate hydrogenlyase subunit 4